MEARLIIDADMSEEEEVRIANGHAVVYSARGPDKPGPNEDAAGLLPVDDERCVLVVADGMGGQPGGESAAWRAVRSLQRALSGAGAGEGALRSAVLDGVEAANREILELGIGAATTLAAVEIGPAGIRAYHVGDSAILVVGQRGRVKLQTVQHSPVGYAIEAGLLDEREALHHEERHLVSNMVGAADMRIEVGSRLVLAARDTLLLASDGLFDNLGIDEIVSLVRKGPLASCAQALAQTARQRMMEPSGEQPSKPDDLTFVLFRPGG